MRPVHCMALLAFAAILQAGPALAVKKVPYPAIAVRPLPGFPGDPGLSEMRKKLAAAAAAKNLDAVVALVSPKFDWTAGGVTVDEFDRKRDAAHNFKIAFGFRAVGRDADGPTDIGPQWELLEFLANDEVLTQESGSPLVCNSLTAKVADAAALDEALMRVDEENDLSEWVYFTDEIALTASPAGGASVGRLKSAALPIVSVHPASPPNATTPPPPPTHFELLLPTGKTGWAPVDKLRPLFVDRLCFARTGDEWKIAVYEQSE